MKYYFAPLEGLTDRIYRQLHWEYFPGIDRYYTPFFSPTVHRSLTPKERKELPPADAFGCTVVPQLLTKNPEDFLWMARQCKDLGYEEVNLNLGCPSGTVTAKGKGSGMLADLDTLDSFLESIFADTPLPISVKTRVGYGSDADFSKVLGIYNRYPIRELTVHPRIRSDFYKGALRMDCFDLAVEKSRAPLCYNGDLCGREQIQTLQLTYPQVASVMLGRGLIADPGMFHPQGNDPQRLESFYNHLLESYLEAFGGSRNAMFRLKEHWSYLINKFEGSEKLYKRLRKTTDLAEYRSITTEIFRTLPVKQ